MMRGRLKHYLTFAMICCMLVDSMPALAEGCLVRFDKNADFTSIYSISEADSSGARLITADNEPYRLAADGRLEPVPGSRSDVTGEIRVISEPNNDGTRLIGAEFGLFRLGAEGRLVLDPGVGSDVTGGIRVIWKSFIRRPSGWGSSNRRPL